MMLWARLSLLVRVTLGTSLALVFSSALLLFVSVERDAKLARAQIDEQLVTEIDSLLPPIAEWAVIGDFANIEQFLRQRVRHADIRSISWMSATGKSLEAIDKEESPRAPDWFVRWTAVLSPGVTRTLSIGGRNYGQASIQMTATPAHNRLWDDFLNHLAILALGLALSIAAITIVLHRGLRPLTALTRSADEVAVGDYSSRIPRQGSPELASLIDAFNHMTAGISEAHGALRDEAERLTVTLSAIGDAVIATAADGSVEFMNPVAEALTGWSAKEAAGRSIPQVFVIINETTREEMECPVGRAMREGGIVGLANQTLLIAKDGSERPIADSAAPIRHADGKIHGAVLVFRDQGPERRAARSLRESEAAYRGLFDGVSEAIYVQNALGRFLDVNQAAERMHGMPRSDFIGKTPGFIAAPGMNDLEALHGIISRAFAGEPQRFEFWGRRANGEAFPEEIHLVRGRYRGQEVVIASATDITERKQAERQLRKLSLAVEQSPDCIVITDLAGRIEYVNQACAQISGYAAEELIGHNPRIQKSGKTPPETYAAMWTALSRGQMWKGELINRRKDGSEYTELAIITPLREPGGQVMHYVAIKQDITEQKRLAVELERHREHLEELVAERTVELTAARAEAERLAQAKSEFLARMSHELRTPLNGVLGLARIGVRDNVGRASHETFVSIQKSGTHLLGVINDILDFSKLDAGKLVVEQQPFALAAAIDNTVSFVSGVARQKGLAFELSAAPDLPKWVSGDARRLQQILANLLSNAVKFTERGEVRLRVASEGGNIHFKVIDTGIGMSEEQAARLFQPFEQADSSTTRKYGGTGLGLAISQNLARLMGGEITAECALGEGSTFTLRLPLPVAEPHLPAYATATGPSERRLVGLHLLAAEDVEINRLILEDLLSHEGAHVIFAEDGQQALNRLEEAGVSAFDAVLMDVQMPVMNGLDATRRLHEMAPALPVIGLTAHAFAEERDKCLAAGMVEHVTKPIDPDLLVAAILRHARPPPPRFASAVTPKPTVVANLVDWPTLLARYPGRETFVARLANIAVTNQREMPAKLRAAAAQPDLQSLAFLAHTLKGVAGNLMAHDVRELAARTEAAAKNSEPRAATLATELASTVETLLDELSMHHSGTQG